MAWGWILVLNLVAWIPAVLKRSEHFYDAIGSLSFLSTLGGVLLWVQPGWDVTILLGCAALWSLRMAWFLVSRIRRRGKDGRFDAIKTDPVRFLNAWSMQALWAFLCLLPVLVMADTGEPAALTPWWLIGVVLWGLGFVIEVAADEQKRRFREQYPDGNRFIRTGLWAWSRHPNYVGEILLWTGLTLASVPALEGWSWVALITPVFVFSLLRFVSGVPLLEQRSDERWGGQADYEAYKASTPVLFPGLG
jgi:steroid 5-alpha reductase family enzyme